ncbi:hypothetical protein DID88_005632 [Monilinia fructigena]|uniref:Uncharacterized protein n=1 Tax=Monilinia fructigena TaxID=38457 RepID=A0A395J0Q1_9HELO|nr:hypothetical protein DID88_005632 [Monilinia fructigena]
MQRQQKMSTRWVSPGTKPLITFMMRNPAVKLPLTIMTEKLSRNAVAEAEPAIALDTFPVASADAGDIGRYLEDSFLECY